MNITIKGMDELQKLLKNMPDIAKSAVHDELVNITQDLKGKSQRLAPLNKDPDAKSKGDLRGSAFAEVEKLDGVVGFTLPYALRQHEELDYVHVDGQAKYLETPLKENIGKYTDSIGEVIKKAVDHR